MAPKCLLTGLLGYLRVLEQPCHTYSKSNQQKVTTVVDGAFVDDALVSDTALTSESLADFPVPIEVVPMKSLVPDETVTGFYPPLSQRHDQQR